MSTEERTLVDAVDRLADWLKWLGIGDAAPERGAIEDLSGSTLKVAENILDAGMGIASAIDNHAEAVERLAKAVEKLTDPKND